MSSELDVFLGIRTLTLRLHLQKGGNKLACPFSCAFQHRDLMTSTPTKEIPMINVATIVTQLRKERSAAAQHLERLDAALAALNGSQGKIQAGRKLSRTARARIAAAQKARWAKVRANGGQKQKVVTMPKKRTLSASARRKIAQAQKARWAKLKSTQRKSA